MKDIQDTVSGAFIYIDHVEYFPHCFADILSFENGLHILCTDTRIKIDQPAKAFVLARNLMISRKYRYLPLLERKADDEDILVRYFSGVLRQLLEDGERSEGFDPRLFRKTVEKIDVQPTGKLAFQFKAGITITV